MNTKEQNPSPMEYCKGMQKCLCAWLEYLNILNNQFLQGKKGSFSCRMGTFQKNCVTRKPTLHQNICDSFPDHYI